MNNICLPPKSFSVLCVAVCVYVCVRVVEMFLSLNFSLLDSFKEYTGPGGADVEVDKPAKEEFTIAKWIKSNVPTKKTKFLNHNVEYFTGKSMIALKIHPFIELIDVLVPLQRQKHWTH